MEIRRSNLNTFINCLRVPTWGVMRLVRDKRRLNMFTLINKFWRYDLLETQHAIESENCSRDLVQTIHLQ